MESGPSIKCLHILLSFIHWYQQAAQQANIVNILKRATSCPFFISAPRGFWRRTSETRTFRSFGQRDHHQRDHQPQQAALPNRLRPWHVDQVNSLWQSGTGSFDTLLFPKICKRHKIMDLQDAHTWHSIWNSWRHGRTSWDMEWDNENLTWGSENAHRAVKNPRSYQERL